MRKILIINIIILCALMSGCLSPKRNPDTTLRSVPLSLFKVNIDEISPVVTRFEEQWCPNGDGYCCIEFKYEGEHPAFFEQFKHLPFKEDWRQPTGVPRYFKDLQAGYYLFHYYKTDPRDHEFLIIDSANRTGVLYCEYS